MLPRDQAALLDILHSANRIAQVAAEQTFDDFARSWVLHQAVVREFEIIGEATKQLSSSWRNQHPEVSWRKMAGLRDLLIHAYKQVDLTVIWEIAQHDIPPLIDFLKPIVSQFASVTDEESTL